MTEVLEKVDWRAQAKNLGIRMYRRTKVDVLADIEAASKEEMPDETSVEPEVDNNGLSISVTQMPGGVSMAEPIEVPSTVVKDGADDTANIICESIEPITEHPKWELDGEPTPVEDLMRRIETLEETVNRLLDKTLSMETKIQLTNMRINHLVDAISKSRRVKGI